MTTDKTEVEQLREALVGAVKSMQTAKAVWFGNTQTPTQCGYLMNSHISAGLMRIQSIVPDLDLGDA